MATRTKGILSRDLVVALLAAGVFFVGAVPQFLAPSPDDQDAVAEYRLSTLRAAIEAYRLEHQQIPDHRESDQSIAGLIEHSAQATSPRGLKEIPANPYTGVASVRITNRTRIVASDVSPDQSGGWLYNPATGQIFLDSVPGFDL